MTSLLKVMHKCRDHGEPWCIYIELGDRRIFVLSTFYAITLGFDHKKYICNVFDEFTNIRYEESNGDYYRQMTFIPCEQEIIDIIDRVIDEQFEVPDFDISYNNMEKIAVNWLKK